jgi:hypothetical protein
MQTETTEREAQEVASWRRDQLLDAGFPLFLAGRLAREHRYDLVGFQTQAATYSWMSPPMMSRRRRRVVAFSGRDAPALGGCFQSRRRRHARRSLRRSRCFPRAAGTTTGPREGGDSQCSRRLRRDGGTLDIKRTYAVDREDLAVVQASRSLKGASDPDGNPVRRAGGRNGGRPAAPVGRRLLFAIDNPWGTPGASPQIRPRDKPRAPIDSWSLLSRDMSRMALRGCNRWRS